MLRFRHPLTPLVAALAVAAALVAVLGLAAPATAQAGSEAASEATPALEVVELPSPGTPLVSVRLLFDVGSIHDPEGKEGLATLTALMVGQAGTAERSYREVVDALYPLAASIDVAVDREVTLVAGTVHRDTLDRYTELMLEAVLTPGFSESDFERNRNQLMSYLTQTLRIGNDELLGLEAIQHQIFGHDHPYGHAPAGTVESLEAITLDDVRAFHREHYTRANLMLGLAGGYPEGTVERLGQRLAALPAGTSGRLELPPLPTVDGRPFTIVQKDTGSVGIHLGYTIPVTRADDDYYPLMVANSYLGEHRTFNGRLMNELRGERGLNYGDYSYIEYYDSAPFTSSPTPNVPRRQQYFSVWVRPVRPETTRFALRAALNEVDKLLDEGLSQEDFELTRNYLLSYSKLWAQTLGERLGFHMDSRFYGHPYWIDEIERQLSSMTRDQVNAAIEKHLQIEDYHAVLVGKEARTLAGELFLDEPSPIEYNSEPDPETLEEDEAIVDRAVEPTSVAIVPVEQMFQK